MQKVHIQKMYVLNVLSDGPQGASEEACDHSTDEKILLTKVADQIG